MTSDHDDFWDDLFLGCAVAAYVDQAAEEGRFPPDSEATRQRAYRITSRPWPKRTRPRNGSEPQTWQRNRLTSCPDSVELYRTIQHGIREDTAMTNAPDAPHLYEPGRRL